MRILWNIHLYFPDHCCGSENMAHHINKFLTYKGHQVRVILNQAEMHNVKVPYTYEGVEVYGPMGNIDQYMWADVLLTHLDFTQQTIQLGQIINKPVINFIHNSHRYNCIENAQKNNYCVYNSQWIKDKLNYRWPGMVFNPPCDWRHYDVCENPGKNEYITLINLDENKGGWILERLAKAMPKKKFMGVMGSYSEPAHLGQMTKMPSNVTIVPKQTDIRPIYKQTRILLNLSRYESWGMTATEAMASGIPVVCAPTDGLKENAGAAGIFINERGPIIKENGRVVGYDMDTYDISYLIKAINKLDDKKYYAQISSLCRQRSRELDPQAKLPQLEDFIINAMRDTKVQTFKKSVRPINMI